MVIEETAIQDCKHIMPRVFYDFRGEYVETWNMERYNVLLPDGIEFVQDDFSMSDKYTLRGFHGDPKTWKLVQAQVGRIQLCLIDMRKSSSTYGKNTGFIISETNRHQVLIPAGVAVAHLCLSEKCIFDYKQTEYYDRDMQFSYRYNSNGTRWPIPDDKIILSDRDRNSPLWERE